MTTETRRRETIIECLRNWKISYQVTGNQTVIDKCMRELLGENKLSWFQYSEAEEFVNTEECDQLGFDAKTELIEFLKLKSNANSPQNDSWDTIRRRVFNRIAQTFSDKMSEIVRETNGSAKTNDLIAFIKQCEHCYRISQNDSFIQLAREAKKVDFRVNDWIQAKAYNEIVDVPNSTIDGLNDSFIKRLADPKETIVTLPPPYVIEQNDDKNTGWLKTWYSKYGLMTHVIIFIVVSGFFLWLTDKKESFWLLECVLAATLANLLIMLYFKFFYQERVQNNTPQ